MSGTSVTCPEHEWQRKPRNTTDCLSLKPSVLQSDQELADPPDPPLGHVFTRSAPSATPLTRLATPCHRHISGHYPPAHLQPPDTPAPELPPFRRGGARFEPPAAEPSACCAWSAPGTLAYSRAWGISATGHLLLPCWCAQSCVALRQEPHGQDCLNRQSSRAACELPLCVVYLRSTGLQGHCKWQRWSCGKASADACGLGLMQLCRRT